MIAEILPDQLLLGGIKNLVDIKEEHIPRLAVVQCITEFEVQAILNREPRWSELFCSTSSTSIDHDENDEDSSTSSLRPKMPIHKVSIDDHPSESISCHLEEAANFIEEQISKNGKIVCVHCNQGVSRSTTVVVAFLMLKRGMRLREACRHVKLRRLRAYPNAGFLEALIELEKKFFDSSASSSLIYPDEDPMSLTVFIGELLEETFDHKKNKDEQQEENNHYRDLLLSAAKYSSSLLPNQESLESAKMFPNAKKLYELITESHTSIPNARDRFIAPLPDQDAWCPPPVQVGIEEFFKLSKIDSNVNLLLSKKKTTKKMNVDDDAEKNIVDVDEPLQMTDRAERRKYLARVFGGEEGRENENETETETEKVDAQDAVDQYRMMVANAEAELEAEHQELERRNEARELEDWEKALLLEEEDEAGVLE